MATKKLSKPTIPQPPVTAPPRMWRCTMCGKESVSPKYNFYTSQSPLHAGNDKYMHICRDCVSSLYNKALEQKKGNELEATNLVCMKLDIYFSPDVLDQAKLQATSDDKFMGFYIQALNRSSHKMKTYEDTLQDNKKVIRNKEDLAVVNNEEKIVAEKTMDFFGEGFTPAEYKYLQDQYNDWITRHECQTKSQEEVFKNLSLAQLRVRKTANTSDSKSYDSAIKSFQDLLGVANLQPKQTKSADTTMVEQNTFGTLLEKWEDGDPVPDVDPVFADVDGIRRLVTVWFFGHLCKMLGIKNDAAAEYEREKAKYDVAKPRYLEDDEADEEISDILKSAMEKGGDS